MPLTLNKHQASLTRSTARRRTLFKKNIPPLENGDCLTQKEFHRRYLAMPDTRAQLIEGVVYMSSPAQKDHGRPLSLLSGLLFHYEVATPGVESFLDTTVLLDSKNEIQPDIALVITPAYGGNGSALDSYFTSAPELVVEIANSTASVDMNQKFEAYRRNKAQEYLVHRVRNKAVDWFGLKDESYHPIQRDKTGVIRSIVFPGLWLDTHALIRRDLPALLKTLSDGIASPEHSAFCARLREASSTRAGKRRE